MTHFPVCLIWNVCLTHILCNIAGRRQQQHSGKWLIEVDCNPLTDCCAPCIGVLETEERGSYSTLITSRCHKCSAESYLESLNTKIKYFQITRWRCVINVLILIKILVRLRVARQSLLL